MLLPHLLPSHTRGPAQEHGSDQGARVRGQLFTECVHCVDWAGDKGEEEEPKCCLPYRRHTPDGNTEISWGPVKGLGGEIHPYRIPREGARKPEKDSEQSLAAGRRTLVTQATLRPGPLLHAGPQGSSPLMAWPGRSQGCWLSQQPRASCQVLPAPRLSSLGHISSATFPRNHFLCPNCLPHCSEKRVDKLVSPDPCPCEQRGAFLTAINLGGGGTQAWETGILGCGPDSASF